MNGLEFPADDLLIKIPVSETSLVTGPAGSGKSTLAASTIVSWAKSSESRFGLVLFLSSLHKMDKLPLHKQLWGEFSGLIKEQDSTKIYEKLLEMKDKILFIIDGIGTTVTSPSRAWLRLNAFLVLACLPAYLLTYLLACLPDLFS